MNTSREHGIEDRLDDLNRLYSRTAEELNHVAEHVNELDGKVTVYSERLTLLSADFVKADAQRLALHNAVAKIEGGIKVLVWMASTAVVIQIITQALPFLASR